MFGVLVDLFFLAKSYDACIRIFQKRDLIKEMFSKMFITMFHIILYFFIGLTCLFGCEVSENTLLNQV